VSLEGYLSEASKSHSTMKTILFVNVKKGELPRLSEILANNGIVGCRLLLCEDLQDLPHILQSQEVHCVFYDIVNPGFLNDLEFLRSVAHEVPRIVCGGKLGKKELVGIINWGTVFYYLEKPFRDYDFTAAVTNALAYGKGIEEKYRKLHKLYIKQQVEKLNKIGISLSSEHNLEKLLGQIVSQALVLAHCDAGSIYFKEGDELAFMVAQNNTLKGRHGEGYEEKYFKRYKFPITKNRISGYVAVTGEVLNIEDAYGIEGEEYTFTDDFDKRTNYHTKSMIVAPMKDADNNILGVLQLINCFDDEGEVVPFDKHLENLILSLASQAAVCIRNARLLEEVKKAHLDTIMRLSVAAEFRDDDTSEHLRRMTNYSLIVAKYLGLSDEERETLRYAAPMHDIGKIGIPDSILFKPGSLTREEWEEMKNHTLYGAQILEGSTSEILKISKIVALNHHERWNGQGYPHGLKKDEIPIFGQIVSIADVFDALASERVYKKALNLDSALEEIRASRDVMFGSHIVDAFMKGIDEIVAVLRNSESEGPRDEFSMNENIIEAQL
jgi:response regulator RpfG family c-di-GMP phosphodiesterase